MAQIIVNGQLGFFNLRSEWKCAYHPSGNGTYYIASGPTTASRDDSFTYTVPEGAIINSARITANWASPNTGFAVKTINGVTPNASNNYLVDVPVSVGTHTLTATFKFRANGRVYSDTATHSGTTAVSDIALIIDYTVPMSTWTLNKGSVEAGGSIAVSVTPAMAGCTHRVTWAFGSQSVVQSMAANVNSQTLSVPMAWCQQMPSATSARAAVTLETIMNGAVLGSETKYFTVTVPPSVVPTAGSLAIAGNNLTWGLYLQNRSTATVTASGYAGAQGSTITAVRVEGGGYAVDGATLTTGTFPSAGTVTFTLRVTDSRGRSATTTAQMTVTAYSTPSITATTEYRADADGSPNGTGTSIGCQVVYTWSEVGSNAAHIKIEYKPTAANAWITALNGSLASGTSQVIGDGNISLVSAWDVRYTLSDDLGSAVVTRKIPTGYVYMRWDPQQNALGFGCYPEGEKRIQLAEDWDIWHQGRKLTGSTRIPGGADLNDYTVPGMYYNDYNVDVASMQNAPVPYAFALLVEKSAGVKQTFTRYDTGDPRMWVRNYYNGTWGSWVEMVNTSTLGWYAVRIAHPVGSLYLSTDSTSPASIFGGTWTQIKDRFLLAAGGSYGVGSYGGEATHTLSLNEMPAHQHTQRVTINRSINAAANRFTIVGGGDLWSAADSNQINHVGGSAAHNNMPPYYAVYMWRRIG